MSPAYPEFSFSHLEGLMKTSLILFNRREDVSFYEIEVFDEEWKRLPFASTAKVLRVEYLEKKTLNIYIRRKDLNKVEYICTRSKLLVDSNVLTAVSSRICSRVKDE